MPTAEYHSFPMVQTYVSLARSYKKEGRITEAFQRFERALDVCYMNDADELLNDIRQQMLELPIGDSPSPEIKKRLEEIKKIIMAKEYLHAGDKNTAHTLFEELAQGGSSDPEIYIQLGALAEEENKKQEASDNLFIAAQFCYSIRAMKRAESYCRRVLAFDPGRLEGRELLVNILRKQGLTTQASVEMLGMVREYLKNNQLNEAFGYVQKAVEIGNIEAHYIQGLIYFREGNLEKAREKFELVNRLNERHTGALSYLTRIYQKQNLIDNATDASKRLISLTPNDPHAYQRLAEVELKQGSVREAITHYQHASQLFSVSGKTEEAESIIRITDQLWLSLREDERRAPEPAAEQLTEQIPVIQTQEPKQLNPRSSDPQCTAYELLSLRYKVLRDYPSENIKAVLSTSEKQVMSNPLPRHVFSYFLPVTIAEYSVLSPDEQRQLKEEIQSFAANNPPGEEVKKRWNL